MQNKKYILSNEKKNIKINHRAAKHTLKKNERAEAIDKSKRDQGIFYLKPRQSFGLGYSNINPLHYSDSVRTDTYIIHT